MHENISVVPALKVPYEDNSGLREMEVRTAQLAQGVIQICGDINMNTAMDTVSSLRMLAEQRKDVKILLNSNGGSVAAGLAVIDAIRSYPHKITVLCVAMAASMGAVILACCPKGNRLILPHAKVMIHEPLISGGIDGSVTTIEKTAQSMIQTKAVINGILAECTGKTIAEIDRATAFDNYMSATEAIAFGLCDRVSNPYEL